MPVTNTSGLLSSNSMWPRLGAWLSPGVSSSRAGLISHKRAGALLYQFGVGLAFLATVRRDGGPRVHPMCPLIHQGGLYGFFVPGPKQADLHRDGRY